MIVQRMTNVQEGDLAVTEFTDMTKITVVLFIVIFVLNLLPAFAPPTWTAMSFIGLTIPSIDFVSLAVVAAAAATFGRITLAKLSRAIVRQRLLSEQTRCNVDAISRRSASNDIRYVPSLLLQPAPIELPVHRLRSNVASNPKPRLISAQGFFTSDCVRPILRYLNEDRTYVYCGHL